MVLSMISDADLAAVIVRTELTTFVDAWASQFSFPDHKGRPNQVGGSLPRDAGAGSGTADDPYILSTETTEDPSFVKIGDHVVIDGSRGVVTKISKKTMTTSVAGDEIDSPSVEKKYEITTITIENDWLQSSKHKFGGLDMFLRKEKMVVPG
jgi:hypothetical protein